MDLKVILRYVGFALLVSALFMFFAVLVSIGNGNDSALAALMISFIITFTVGVFPFIFVRNTSAISLREGYMIIVLSWMLSFVFGMMPYLLWGGPFSVTNAWFESVSGFTTTGATILDDIEALPKSLIFWRSATHFIGGLGVVVFLMLVIPSTSPMRLRLANMELSSLSKSGYKVRANKTVFIFTYVYLGIFALTYILYVIGGMPSFDAVNNAFSVCATGGFCPRNESIGAYGSDFINIVTIVMMTASSVHFAIIYMVFVTKSLKPLGNSVFKFYLSSMLVAAVAVAFALKIDGTETTWKEAAMNAGFHVASYVSTTGFSIADNAGWSQFVCFILILLSFQCGMAGSTSGGFKADRAFLLIKTLGKYLGRTLHPSSVSEVRIGGRIIKDEEIYPHLVYFALYVILCIASTLLLMLLGNGEYAVPECIASLSNVGLSFGKLGTYGNYNWLNEPTKILLTLNMFLGRVEIYPVLAVISMIFDKKAGS